MKKIRIVALLAAAALASYPFAVHAQEDDEEYEDDGEDDEDDEDEDEDEDYGEPIEEGAGLGDICKIDPAACPEVDFEAEAARDIKEQMYAVQQVFVLRARRFELQPYWAISLNDQFVGHPGPGLGMNYWITQVMAVGVNGTYYQPFNTDSAFNFETRRAARVGVPLSEYQWGAALNFTYVPVAGKFSGFGEFIFQYDAYLVGGVGAISTRPIPTIDPDNRFFEYSPKLAFNAGVGLRVFFSRWFAATMEVRNYVFNDELENTSIAATADERADDSTWYGDNSITNNVQAQLGVSVFIPFTFDYRLPK
jgi:outer membrane beta-barrel protein